VGAREVEVEFLPGLGPFVLEEIEELFGGDVSVPRFTAGACRVRVRQPERLLQLRTAVAVHLVECFEIPRPKALLGHEAMTRLVTLVEAAMAWSGRTSFRSFRLNAAGRDSAVFQRLAEMLHAETGLEQDRWGDLLVRVRRVDDGWEVLARTSPRPLSARAWRTHNFRGALNATIAAALVRATRPKRDDRYCNLMCGSGTLLAERLACGPADAIVGIDNDADVLAMAGYHAPDAALVIGDVRTAPFDDAVFDVLTADLPYGQAVGSHAENDELYGGVLGEAARVAKTSARFAVITHDIRRFRRALAAQSAWRAEHEVQVFQKGHNPYVWLLVAS